MSGDSTTTSAMEISGDKIDSKDGEATTTAIESQILAAMQSRVTYLRDKADNFTFEGVRRLLEEDLKLEKHALDAHKSFVKQHLLKCLEGAENDETSENSQETEEKKDVKEDTTGDDEKTEDSPVMGLLTEENTSQSVAEQTKDEDSKEVLQSDIKKALRKRASYIKANSEKITMGLLRRLLEQDLKLEKYSLDPYKKFINGELDEILQALEATKSSTKAQRKTVTKKVKSTPAKNSDSEEMSDSDGDDDKEVTVKKKKTAEKRKSSKSEGTGKRKREKEKLASAKKTKQTDSQSDSDAGEKASSSEKSVKKQETPTTGYGKRVEHLKSIIKSCGMSISPSVYRKAKQAPEEKREETLIKELKELLAKEGLSANPSEKEIKEVKKRKERTKELEGIDTSNIVSSSRRRSTASFVPPPKPIKAEESESDESEDSENEEDEDEEVVVEEDEDEEEDEGGNKDGGEGSQNEGEPNTEDGGEEESE
ncbi:DNA ligase 1 isoform X2 [Arabidopsis lyrata subsp. lyrata]|uniref:DNA ligase 1 isoform X2 n=1 Tax=Arabidopsis lyrata subsp. lyrata TaxID=81972 RepID=UPI000A29E34B|nr:DNA ligase 1 isoform X2 [Arabidopsis lyrata subsp. lyrata]|eukprot:XP_020877465.1 DNA ligase 1 isoform X2 [Arabidopsis lyrata subsp. lyrata]